MNKTAKKAQDHVKECLKIKLYPPGKNERGFDFKNRKNRKATLFIEVKGSEKTVVPFRFFTDAEYKKAKKCLHNGNRYEIHLVLGVGNRSVAHYKIPAKALSDSRMKQETWWRLPIGKNAIQTYKKICPK
jgi:hypothetical protein